MPDGTIGKVNELGIAYYNKLIDALLANGITPVITIFHFDVPQVLQNLGGFYNEVIVDYFEDYADLVFSQFGNRVKYWITINEPSIFCKMICGEMMSPTIQNVNGTSEYLCGANTLKAHAVAYRLYQAKYAEQQKGMVGITLHSQYYYSRTNNAYDVERALDFEASSILFHLVFTFRKCSHFTGLLDCRSDIQFGWQLSSRDA